jgi:hypothetical protein
MRYKWNDFGMYSNTPYRKLLNPLSLYLVALRMKAAHNGPDTGLHPTTVPKPTFEQQACNALWSYAKQDMVVAGVDRGVAFTITIASWGLDPFADATAIVFGATAAVYFTTGLVESTAATAQRFRNGRLGRAEEHMPECSVGFRY